MEDFPIIITSVATTEDTLTEAKDIAKRVLETDDQQVVLQVAVIFALSRLANAI